MSELLNRVPGFLKSSQLNTDSKGCKLVHKWIPLYLLFVGSSIFLTNIFGVAITCKCSTGYSQEMDRFCFSSGTHIYGELVENTTYTLQEAYRGVRGSHNVRVRIGPGLHSRIKDVSETVLLSRIMFVPYIYFVLAFLCYVPRLHWKSLQGKSIPQYVRNFNDAGITAEALKTSVNLASSLFARDTVEHDYFGIKYFITLIEYIGILVGIEFFLVFYVGYQNWYFAIDALVYLETPYDQYPYRLALSFPQRASCLKTEYGVSGEIQIFDALCELHHARLNQFYMAVTFWVVLVGVLVIGREIFWMAISAMFPAITRASCIFSLRIDPKGHIGNLLQKLDYGSLFVIQILDENLHPQYLFDILLAAKFEIDNLQKQLVNKRKGNLVIG